jgi:hypothetical protein
MDRGMASSLIIGLNERRIQGIFTKCRSTSPVHGTEEEKAGYLQVHRELLLIIANG